ncbi:glycoside hydrolase/phage tail family protein [Methylosinus sp. H3A]|uniref:baseplate multidomain protein megatron n=1 Tax=Methylosinus sp. H3A TaxID=2785786 RepID=UPI0018C259DE|nr:glycoside hydrolase/phage tail family protein [Methylosinus sp. H3A]MBG0810593.1 glycoside hydrolase/phage tail family protein [Methylosinus sp. H3A]
MATLLLQTAGAAIAPVGSILGNVLAGVGGVLVDAALQPRAATRYEVGPRLKAMDGVASTEGAAIPRVYGRVRIGGQMIWATRFLEQANVSLDGGSGNRGKGGGGSSQTVNVTYSYYANFAIGLCEGPIAFVRRIFADGNELDMTSLPIRIYNGDEEQLPDPLIVAKEGAENAPAYRGLAYIVFEQLALASFGNRIPQFTFEVTRPVAGLGEMIRAIDVIPGATEAGYQPSLQLNFFSPGATSAENRHQSTAASDWTASIDALQALCPNLESVALVVSWFGDDLRAGHCSIAPRVDATFKTIGEFDYVYGPYWPADWSVAGLNRASARLVSQLDGRAAFGGTPSDASVRAAIADLRARGLSVVFYPFVMMDVPPDNILPDPRTGAAGQPAFPWRGRITCDPAPGRAGAVDGTSEAATQVAAFFAQYRSFILHYAELCEEAGGVDAFLIGSELVALTRIRSAVGVFPAVAALEALAVDVKSVVRSGVKIGYAADWTEYGGQVLEEGEVRFPLDRLWASTAIDFVGIDIYWPLSDWRDGVDHLDAQIAASVYEIDYLGARVASGEGYDWFYASEADRQSQTRAPIADALGKPWMFRVKDLVAWWSNAHHERVGGAELSAATGWTPQSKPIWIVETGCPAVDRGANGPNVFPDAHSSEGGFPYFSRGGRDDLMQARVLEAMIAHFDPTSPGGDARNPLSPIYGGRMVDSDRVHVWCWDARPFPAFPGCSDVWADAANWETGHWLNGRLEGAPLDRLVSELASTIETGDLRVERPAIHGFVDGYVLDAAMSPREAIEPLASLFGFEPIVSGGALRFVSHAAKIVREIGDGDLVPNQDGTLVELRRAQESELPHEIALSFGDSEFDYRTGRVLSRRLEGYSSRRSEAQTAVMIGRANAQRLADIWLQDIWAGRETARFSVRPGLVMLEPGDVVSLASAPGRLLQVTQITDGAARAIEARAVDPSVYDVCAHAVARRILAPPGVIGPPRILVLDLAIAKDGEMALSHVAAFADPWPGALAIWRKIGSSFESIGLIEKRATIGETLDALAPGPLGCFDHGASVTVKLASGALASVDDGSAFALRSAMAIRGADGAWEIFAFTRAELVAADTYRLSRLLRGIGGEDSLASRSVAAGATVVLLDDAIVPLAVDVAEIDSARVYRIGPADRDHGDPTFVELDVAATRKSLAPYSPTHAQAWRTTEGVEISFTRRGRIDADAWEPFDIPLGEESEAFDIVVALPGGGERVLSSATDSVVYAASDELADFGAPQTSFALSIFQIGARVGRGFPLVATLFIE